MIEIRPHALYTRHDLIELLRPLGINADAFVARLKPKKVFRNAWFGEHLLDALAEAPALRESERKSNPRKSARNTSRGQGRDSARKRSRTRLEASLEPLKALARENHERSAD